MQIHFHLAAGFILSRYLYDLKFLSACLFFSIFPDLPYIYHYVKNTFSQGIKAISWRFVLGPRWSTVIAKSLHSIPLFLILVFITWCFLPSFLSPFFYCYLGHLILDYAFHAPDYYRPFYPFSDFSIHIPLSYYDPKYGAKWVNRGAWAIVLLAVVSSFWWP